MGPEARHCPFCNRQMPAVSAGRVCDSPSCRVGYQRHLQAGGRTCRVCGIPLWNDSPGAPLVCEKLSCQMQYLRQTNISDEQRCRVCKVPLPSYRMAAGDCGDRECGIIVAGWRLAEAVRREEARIASLIQAGELLKIQEAGQSSVENPDGFSVAVVPHLAARITPSDQQKVERIRERLRSLVQWAFSHEFDDSELPRRPGWDSSGHATAHIYHADDIAEEASSVESPIFSTGCRMCRGYCCVTGSEHAYLNIGLIRDFIAENSDLAEEQVVQAYMQYVPESSFENSCIFHGEMGCTLPRNMRSDMCNRWLCPGLKRVRESLEHGTPPLFFIVASDEKTSSEEIVASSFVDARNHLSTEMLPDVLGEP